MPGYINRDHRDMTTGRQRQVRDYLNPVDMDKFVEGTPGERFFQVTE